MVPSKCDPCTLKLGGAMQDGHNNGSNMIAWLTPAGGAAFQPVERSNEDIERWMLSHHLHRQDDLVQV